MAASDGLNVFGMYGKSFGYGVSTFVAMKGARGLHTVMWGAKVLNCFGHSDIFCSATQNHHSYNGLNV